LVKIYAMFPLCSKSSTLLIILFLILRMPSANCQVEKESIPPSIFQGEQIAAVIPIQVSPPDPILLKSRDEQAAMLGEPYRIGVSIPLDIELCEAGKRIDLADGSRLWVLKIMAEGALGLGLDFDRYILPPGAELFLSSPDHSMTAGAFTSMNQAEDLSFSIRPVTGDEVMLELYLPPADTSGYQLHINCINYIYRGFTRADAAGTGFGEAGTCHVNVACEEGSGWNDQANGVVKILIRNGGDSFWCSGSLLNNTRFDFAPLLITANHCAINKGHMASPADLQKWVFYFRYQTPGCANPLYEPVAKTLTGAVNLACSQQPVEIGSDFYLLRLSQQIPASYQAYYNGWSRETNPAEAGVCIHHPRGDVKKISTFNTRVESGKVQSIPGTHWIADWIPTKNGHGVVEPGSSGSPLFNENGLVVGTCTGGYSSCDYSDGTDYFGKISFSWNMNGETITMGLSTWLDPVFDGRLTLEGGYNNQEVIADFYADRTLVAVGSEVNFYDRSARGAETWKWFFEGAEPSTSDSKNPSGILYPRCGRFNVTCIAGNSNGSDTLVKKGFIEVKSVLYPNPSRGTVTIFTNDEKGSRINLKIYDAFGRFISGKEWPYGAGPAITLDLPEGGNLYFVQLIIGNEVQIHKVVMVK